MTTKVHPTRHDDLDEFALQHLRRVEPATLQFGDRLPYFAANVRSVAVRSDNIVRVTLVRPGVAGVRGLTFGAGDLVHTLRAGYRSNDPQIDS